MTDVDDLAQWPTDKLTALRLGRALATELTPPGPGRRAFVTIRPGATDADHEAARAGWVKLDRRRAFVLEHWDYDASWLDSLDFDIDAVPVRAVTVSGEAELDAALREWNLRPEQFRYPWQTDDPRA